MRRRRRLEADDRWRRLEADDRWRRLEAGRLIC
jgi:hypothetical protein